MSPRGTDPHEPPTTAGLIRIYTSYGCSGFLSTERVKPTTQTLTSHALNYTHTHALTSHALSHTTHALTPALNYTLTHLTSHATVHSHTHWLQMYSTTISHSWLPKYKQHIPVIYWLPMCKTCYTITKQLNIFLQFTSKIQTKKMTVKWVKHREEPNEERNTLKKDC